ncbi:hydantoinase B/oxoprolinase family protein [Desulfofundulus thermosubterraneus]|uniref:N-methylhydantoinase B n=1 Tax=Desulfofundulus thermosubterraneus DSM 16057 TaxID=1121432 RepID=A0A1M6A6U3_9FIRM|nr:hydantoinase B/oxoprolinase family protein [Desulfofundulus thermosubterraneus]SHI32166.1 N-methylhydantoinase B [Desulfofundulus thermosubterraneus DSM 16057]
MAKVDPFTRENIAQGLIAAAEEMFLTWGRTSQSTIIYEVLDYACGLTDARGNLIAQANGVTGFLGAITYSVISTLEKFGPENLKPGDIILTNDPFTGSGTHLCDVSAVLPIFYDGELVAFAANKGHWNEIGGKNLGSWSTNATEIYQEGLQFPVIKIYEEGKLNEAVRDMIAANCRTPDMTLGDLYAQTASLRIAEKRVLELFDKYGKDAVMESIKTLLENGRKLALKELAKMPKGTFEAESYIDANANGLGDVYIKVKVTITDDSFVVDLSESGNQIAAPINCTKFGAYSAGRIIYHALLNPDAEPNEGFYSPLKVIVREGSVFAAVRPAPVSTNWEALSHITDLVAKALAPVIPERITAGHFLSIIGTILAGIEDETGQPFVLCEPQAGGWGAGYNKDGENGLVAIADGETYMIPVEVAEYKYPIIVEQYAFNLNTGAGKFRGGCGLIRDYRLLNSNAELTTIVSRHRIPPWGFAGGKDGSPNVVEIHPADGSEPIIGATFSNYPMRKGDLVRFISGCGGGYGDPLERPVEKVWQDVKDEYITIEAAAREYGVIIDPVTLEIDREKTEKLREEMSRQN